MPGLYEDEAVVLRTMKLGDADRIVTLFTRNNGKVRAVAKGIRKTKSRFGGRLEPFTQVGLLLYRGRDLDTITGVDVIASFRRLRDDFGRLTAASVMAEVVEKIVPDREKALSTYDLLVAGLHAVEEDRGASVVPAFLVKLLSVSGFHPQLKLCSGCGDGRGLEAFSPALGGAVCVSCWEEDDTAMRLSSERLALMVRLLTDGFGVSVAPDEVADVTDALRRYAEYHLERPLKSMYLLPVH